MILRRISHRIALQFTAFVFILLLINGLFFIAADFGRAYRGFRMRMEQSLLPILENFGDIGNK